MGLVIPASFHSAAAASPGLRVHPVATGVVERLGAQRGGMHPGDRMPLLDTPVRGLLVAYDDRAGAVRGWAGLIETDGIPQHGEDITFSTVISG